MRQEIVEIDNIKRLDYFYMLTSAEFRVRRLAHDGIHMNGIYRPDVRMLLDDAPYRAEHVVHRLAEVLAPVRGYHYQPAVGSPVEPFV